MFPDTDNNLGLISGKKYLDLCNKNIPFTNCLLEALIVAWHVATPFLRMRIIYK